MRITVAGEMIVENAMMVWNTTNSREIDLFVLVIFGAFEIISRRFAIVEVTQRRLCL